MNESNLRIHEELMLIALRDQEGTRHWRADHCGYALSGALLAELVIEERISIASDKKQTVGVINASATGNEVLDHALRMVNTAKKPRGAADWVQRFSRIKGLAKRVTAALCSKGILREDEGKVLLIFNRRIYPTLDPVPERRIRERIRRAITGLTLHPKARTAVLISLADAAGLLRIYFEKQLLKQHKSRIKQIASGEVTGGATAAAIQAAQAAATAAIVAATVATTAATSG
jgi:golgi phosphoprotein 3